MVSLSTEFAILDENKILDLTTGEVGNSERFQNLVHREASTLRYYEVIHGKDEEIIELKLSDFYGSNPIYAGFLVEVFMSTSSGFQKVYRKDVIDEKTGDISLEGFEKYFYLEDK